jgi:hypothetical protein
MRNFVYRMYDSFCISELFVTELIIISLLEIHPDDLRAPAVGHVPPAEKHWSMFFV